MIFNVSVANLINLIFIAAGIGVCGLCFLQITSSSHLRREVRRYFQIFFALITVYISAHLARQLMDGIAGGGVRFALNTVTFLEMTAAGFMAYMMSMLILTVSKPEKFKKQLEVLLLAVLCVHVVLMAADRFGNFIFYFDDLNVYHRGTLYLLSNLCPVIMLVTDIVLLIKYRKNIDKKVNLAFWIYMIAPIAAIIIQSFSYGVQFIIFATVGAAVFMFSVIVRNQNDIYEKQQKENSRIETELSMASSIQFDMLPNIYPAFPDRPEFDIYASMTPAKEVGGDFYDFFLVDDDHLCMVMADVSGKGVPAALFMMASKIILANNAMLGKTPAQILTDTNNAVCSNNREEMFVTVWLGILELSTGELSYANAGHEYPALMQANGRFELIKEKHELVLGGVEGLKYKEHNLKMEPGSKIFLYTDGVVEATNLKNELFGTDRLISALNDDLSAEPEDILKFVREKVDVFVDKAEQFDDLTMLCIEYKGN